MLQVCRGKGWSGGENVVLSLATGMRQLGLEVAVVSFADGPLARSLERAGIPVEVLGLRSRADPRGASRLWRLLRSRRPDVLHSHGPGAMVIANPLGRLAGVPAVVTTFHHMAGGGRAVTNQPLHAIYYRLEGLVGRIATDACVAYAEATREDAIRVRGVPAERVVAIHNGIDLARFGPLAPAARGAARAEWRARLGIGADALVVGAIGRLLPAKGHEHLVRALPAIRAERPEAVLVVVGDGPLAGRLREIGDRLGLGDALVLPGALRASPDLYACFDVFVYPSIIGVFGLVVLEAMACRVPVVASALPGSDILLREEENALLAAPGDPVGLARATLRLAADTELRERLLDAAARDVREQFSAEAMVERYVALYRALLAGQPVTAAQGLTGR